MKEIIRYGENNFSEESLNILKEEIFQEMLKEIEKEDYHSKALSIKEALKKRPYEIFRHYVFYSLDEKIYEKDKKYYLSNIIGVILIIPFISFIMRPNKLTTILSIGSVMGSIFEYKLLMKHSVPFSIVPVAGYWIMGFVTIAISPYFLFRRVPVSTWFTYPIISIFIFAMIGLWITQEIWKGTPYEKRNINTFIAHNKFLFLFEIKNMPIVRYIWLWLTVVFTILCTIFMYSFIFYKLLRKETTLVYCIFLSISTYFNAGYFSLDSIGLASVDVYLLSEVVISFLLNTFYLAYIANLLFELKMKK